MKEETNKKLDEIIETANRDIESAEKTLEKGEKLLSTPQQVLSQSREEFENKFESYEEPEKYLTNRDIENGKLKAHKDFLTSTLQAFLEAEIARLEGMKKSENSRDYDFGGETTTDRKHNEMRGMDNIFGYNQALQDQINHLKELLVTLKR